MRALCLPSTLVNPVCFSRSLRAQSEWTSGARSIASSRQNWATANHALVKPMDHQDEDVRKAVAYALAIGNNPGAPNSAGIIGVYRGVTINAFYSFGSAPDPTLEDGLPKIFNAAVAKLDAV